MSNIKIQWFNCCSEQELELEPFVRDSNNIGKEIVIILANRLLRVGVIQLLKSDDLQVLVNPPDESDKMERDREGLFLCNKYLYKDPYGLYAVPSKYILGMVKLT